MTTLKDIGEKNIIHNIIKPLFNPSGDKTGVGDDCAVIGGLDGFSICVSTDRVPSDLISYKLGIIDIEQLGYYLSILNISDIAAAGARPLGLLLNLAFPDNFLISDLKKLLNGIRSCCNAYGCHVIGGDLSNSNDLNLVATSIGIVKSGNELYRSNANIDDLIFCSKYIGLTPTAFKYFKDLKPAGYALNDADESLLASQFRMPSAMVNLGNILSDSGICSACMDNTDGFSQTVFELSELNNMEFTIYRDNLPIHPVTKKICNDNALDLLDLLLSAGADFQLIGTLRASDRSLIQSITESNSMTIIGKVTPGSGATMVYNNGYKEMITPRGWNYYI